MSTMIVAKKDFEDALQSKTIWALTATIVIVTSFLAYSLVSIRLFSIVWPWFLTFFSQSQLQSLEFVQFFLGPAMLVIPLLALIVTHKSIIGEIEVGTSKFLFSNPLTRWHVYSGKFLGRSAVITAAVVLSLLLTRVVVLFIGEDLEFTGFTMVVLSTILLGIAYGSIGFSISAIAPSQSRAVIYITSFYIFFQILIGWVNNFVLFFTQGRFLPTLVDVDVGSGPADAPAWFHFIPQIAPQNAFQRIMLEAQGVEPHHLPAFPGGEPMILGPTFAVVILLFWVFAPLTLGYVMFSRADLAK